MQFSAALLSVLALAGASSAAPISRGAGQGLVARDSALEARRTEAVHMALRSLDPIEPGQGAKSLFARYDRMQKRSQPFNAGAVVEELHRRGQLDTVITQLQAVLQRLQNDNKLSRRQAAANPPGGLIGVVNSLSCLLETLLGKKSEECKTLALGGSTGAANRTTQDAASRTLATILTMVAGNLTEGLDTNTTTVTNGTATNGTATNGTATNGTATNGTATNGTSTSTTSSNSTALPTSGDAAAAAAKAAASKDGDKQAAQSLKNAADKQVAHGSRRRRALEEREAQQASVENLQQVLVGLSQAIKSKLQGVNNAATQVPTPTSEMPQEVPAVDPSASPSPSPSASPSASPSPSPAADSTDSGSKQADAQDSAAPPADSQDSAAPAAPAADGACPPAGTPNDGMYRPNCPGYGGPPAAPGTDCPPAGTPNDGMYRPGCPGYGRRDLSKREVDLMTAIMPMIQELMTQLPKVFNGKLSLTTPPGEVTAGTLNNQTAGLLGGITSEGILGEENNPPTQNATGATKSSSSSSSSTNSTAKAISAKKDQHQAASPISAAKVTIDARSLLDADGLDLQARGDGQNAAAGGINLALLNNLLGGGAGKGDGKDGGQNAETGGINVALLNNLLGGLLRRRGEPGQDAFAGGINIAALNNLLGGGAASKANDGQTASAGGVNVSLLNDVLGGLLRASKRDVAVGGQKGQGVAMRRMLEQMKRLVDEQQL